MKNLFRDCPQAAVDILQSLGVDLPDTSLIREESPVFNTRPSDDLESDLVLVLGPPQQPLRGIAVEAQGDKSKDPVQLARYAAAGWLQLRCPFHVLVVTQDRKVAEYYAKPVMTGLPGYAFQAIVLGPHNVPVITTPVQVVAHPVLAAFGVAIHGRDPAVRSAFANGIALLPSDYTPTYTEHAYCIAPREIQLLLEDDMSTTDWPVHTPFAKEHFGRGLTEGRAEGKAEGKAEEAARMLLLVLEARGLTVPEELRSRITSCTDIAQLESWTSKAANAATIQELFD